MVKGTTRSGFEFEVNGMLLHDVEFLENLAAVETGRFFEVFGVIEKMLGKEQKEALYEHIRDDNGIVQRESLKEEMNDLFEALSKADETKN